MACWPGGTVASSPVRSRRSRHRKGSVLRALLATPGVEVPAGCGSPAGRAEVEVGYLERLPAGRLREPVACAVQGRPVAELLLSAAESLHGEVQYQPPPLTMIPPPGRPAV